LFWAEYGCDRGRVHGVVSWVALRVIRLGLFNLLVSSILLIFLSLYLLFIRIRQIFIGVHLLFIRFRLIFVNGSLLRRI